MSLSDSWLVTLDRSGQFRVGLVHIGPDGTEVDPFFNINLNHLQTGPALGHDMLLTEEVTGRRIESERMPAARGWRSQPVVRSIKLGSSTREVP